jgi:hypothetical protein
MKRDRLMIGITAAFLILGAAACGSSGQVASGGTPRPTPIPMPSLASSSQATATPSVSAVTPAGTPVPSPSPAPGASTPAAGPLPAGTTCAQLAKHTFIHLTAVKAGTGGALTLTGNPASMVCGGPDDFHYNVATTTQTGHVNPGAVITVFPITTGHPVAISAGRLASYLATDQGTRIFLVTGALSAISGLAEQFHP